MAEGGEAELFQPKRYAIKFNPPRFILEYTDGKKTRIRSVRSPQTMLPRSLGHPALQHFFFSCVLVVVF